MSCLSDSTLRRFVHGEESPRAETVIVSHLELCGDCRRRADRLFGGEAWMEASQSTKHGSVTEAGSPEVLTALRDELRELESADFDLNLTHDYTNDDLLSSDRKLWRLLFEEKPDGFEGSRIGRFRLTKLLGAGGFGIVFKAHDEVLRRDVALKLPRINAFVREDLRTRSLREAEAAAMLHHPNIVAVLEAGQQGPLFYIAYYYCEGPTLEEWMKEHTEPVDLYDVVEIVRQLANGIFHAHQHGILHRDIKPSNILLEPAPNSALPFAPKITDFGLAKFIDDDALATGSRCIIGTPAYMSPEHAQHGAGSATTRSDIYALGVVLYELLVGRRPINGKDYGATLHRVIHDEPKPPRKRAPHIPRDLEAICMKCLEKDPAARYETAGQLRDDLHRFLNGEATVARPLSEMELFRRWAVRNPVIATLCATIFIGLLLSASGLLLHNHFLDQIADRLQRTVAEKEAARGELLENEQRLRNLLYVSEMNRAERAIRQHDYRQAAQLLRNVEEVRPRAQSEFPWAYLHSQTRLRPAATTRVPGELYNMALSPIKPFVAAVGSDAILRLYDATTLALRGAKPTGQGESNAVAFSPDGNRIVTTGDDGTVCLYALPDLRVVYRTQPHREHAFGVRFSPDGQHLITTGQDRTWRVLDAANGETLWTSPKASRAIEEVALSPDGTYVATAGSDGTVRIWNLETKAMLVTLRGHSGRVLDVCFSADGRFVASASLDRTVRMWRTGSWGFIAALPHVDELCCVRFIDSLPGLVTGDTAGVVHLWHFSGKKKSQPEHQRSWMAHRGRVWKVQWDAERQRLLSAGEDGVLALWQWEANRYDSTIRFADAAYLSMALDDQLVLLGLSQRGALEVWDLTEGIRTQQEQLPNVFAASDGIRSLQLAGGRLLEMSPEGPLRSLSLHDPYRYRQLEMKALRERLFPDGKVPQNVVLRCDRNGDVVGVRWEGTKRIVVWDMGSGEAVFEAGYDCNAHAISADGRRLAVNDGNDIVLIGLPDGNVLARLRGHASTIRSLAFSDDQTLLASGSNDRQIILWNVAEEQPIAVLQGHRDMVQAVAFSHSGDLLASGDGSGQLRIWLVPERTALLTVPGQSSITDVEFGADDRRLLISHSEGFRLLGPHRWPLARTDTHAVVTSRQPSR